MRANAPSAVRAALRTISRPTPSYSSASLRRCRRYCHDRTMCHTPRTGSRCRHWTIPATSVHVPRTTFRPTQFVSKAARRSASHRRARHSSSWSFASEATPRMRPTMAYWSPNAPRKSRFSRRSSSISDSSSSVTVSPSGAALPAVLLSPIPALKSSSAAAKSLDKYRRVPSFMAATAASHRLRASSPAAVIPLCRDTRLTREDPCPRAAPRWHGICIHQELAGSRYLYRYSYLVPIELYGIHSLY